MFRRKSIARLCGGAALVALVASPPATVLAQWWDPVGALPRPPSVGEFMMNPMGDAPIARGGTAYPRGYGQRRVISAPAYAVRPVMVSPAATVVRPVTVFPSAYAVRPVTVVPRVQVVRPMVVMPRVAVVSPYGAAPSAAE